MIAPVIAPVTEQLKLRTLYALHMILPASIVAWHLLRLDGHTLERLRALFA